MNDDSERLYELLYITPIIRPFKQIKLELQLMRITHIRRQIKLSTSVK